MGKEIILPWKNREAQETQRSRFRTETPMTEAALMVGQEVAEAPAAEAALVMGPVLVEAGE
jgi:hypothetical protein